jgi:hypothetical protein
MKKLFVLIVMSMGMYIGAMEMERLTKGEKNVKEEKKGKKRLLPEVRKQLEEASQQGQELWEKYKQDVSYQRMIKGARVINACNTIFDELLNDNRKVWNKKDNKNWKQFMANFNEYFQRDYHYRAATEEFRNDVVRDVVEVMAGVNEEISFVKHLDKNFIQELVTISAFNRKKLKEKNYSDEEISVLVEDKITDMDVHGLLPKHLKTSHKEK